ncbi:hypothetical protein E6H35_09625 [Candidatus Bathyarchaeota archaeon]|nr:MAG: hypothetical protein E6H35_09625 [Candidatus Bathyarchaeota archaeon]
MQVGPYVTRRYLPALFTMILAFTIYPLPSVLATSNTPTYVLGVSNPTDPLIVDLQGLTSSLTILPSVTGLSLVGSNSILFVDGSWLQSVSSVDPTVLSLVAQEPLKAIPTIVVRGAPSLIANSIARLVSTKVPNLPLISEGVQIIGTLPDGTPQGNTFQVIAGFDYAVHAEFSWAQQLLPKTGVSAPLTGGLAKRTVSPLATPSGPSFGSWTFAANAQTSTGDFFSPVARVSYNFTGYELQNSGSSSYKWFNFFTNETLQPGISTYSNSNWRTAEEIDHVVLNNQTSNLLVSHGPQLFSTSGPSVLTYTIGTQAGFLNALTSANQTQSYFLKNTQVTDITTNSTSNIGWDHQVNAQTSAGKLTFSIIPGWTDRITAPGRIDLRGVLTSYFEDFSTNSVRSTSLSFSIFGG